MYYIYLRLGLCVHIFHLEKRARSIDFDDNIINSCKNPFLEHKMLIFEKYCKIDWFFTLHALTGHLNWLSLSVSTYSTMLYDASVYSVLEDNSIVFCCDKTKPSIDFNFFFL